MSSAAHQPLGNAPAASLRLAVATLIGLAILAASNAHTAEPSANAQFSAVKAAAQWEGPSVHGSYANGCVAGAEALSLDGPGWTLIRPSRNRMWGHPSLIAYVKWLASETAKAGGPALVIADLGQPRGGPMPFGHSSHQVGLDADIWLRPPPEKPMSPDERETLAEISMIQFGALGIEVDPAKFGPNQKALLKRAASHKAVARIFVHAGIKKALCESETGDRAWLRKIRSWHGHDGHMHVRLLCPEGETACKDQPEIADGDGCAEAQGWLRRKAPASPPDPEEKPRIILRNTPMRALPAACRAVLSAPAKAGQAP